MSPVFLWREVCRDGERGEKHIAEIAFHDAYLPLGHQILADDHDRDLQILYLRLRTHDGLDEPLEAGGVQQTTVDRYGHLEERGQVAGGYDRHDLVARETGGIQHCYDGAHRIGDYVVWFDALLLKILQDAQMGECTGRSSCENKSDRVPLAVRTLEDPLSKAILTVEHRHIGEQQVVGSQGRLSFNHLDRRRPIGTTYDPDVGGILRHECG